MQQFAPPSRNIVIWFTVLFSETWESSYVVTVINSSIGSIFAQTAGFNMTKTLTIFFCVFISLHVFMEENVLNLVMLGDMHMQLCTCYSFVVETWNLHC